MSHTMIETEPSNLGAGTNKWSYIWALLTLLMVMCYTPPNSAQTARLTDDATITYGPAPANGSSAALVLGGGGPDLAVNTVAPATTTNSYLKFDLSTLRAGVTGGQVSKATLSLYVNHVYAPGALDVLAVMDPWDEKSIQVSNAHFSLSPDDAVRGVPVGAEAEGQFISVDVTTIVRSWLDGRAANYGLALTDGSLGTDLRFDGKENASTSHEPRLEIALVGLPGSQGPTGPQGPAGPKGEKGDSGNGTNTQALEARISKLQRVLNRAAFPIAYVTNLTSGTVSVIDASSNTVVTTIKVGEDPRGVVLNPSGTRAYVANSTSNTVSVIDTSSNTVVETINVEKSPQTVAVNPSGTRAYVANYESDTVSVIDTSNNTVVANVNVGNGPMDVSVNPSGTRAYVANLDGTVSVIDTSNNTQVATVDVLPAQTVAVNPFGTRIYTTGNYRSDGGYKVVVIDTSSNTEVARIRLDGYPSTLVVNRSGSRVYVTIPGNGGPGKVSVIDTSSNVVVGTIRVGDTPWGVAVNPSGTRAYVANYRSGTVSVIDTSNNTVVGTIPGFHTPVGIAFK